MIKKSIKVAITLLCLCTLPSLSNAKPSPAITKLVPNGWKILSSSEGDLNKDIRADVAIIIEKLKPDVVIKGDDGKAIHNNPRKFLVFLNHQSGYQLVTENKTIPVAEEKNSCLQDPLEETDGVKINKGILSLDFSYFMACGGWEWPRHFYTFRWQNNQFQLIGFDYNSFYRNSGEMTDKSYNFSTSKLKEIVGDNMFEGGKPKTKWSTFKKPQTLNLKDINFDDLYSQFNDSSIELKIFK